MGYLDGMLQDVPCSVMPIAILLTVNTFSYNEYEPRAVPNAWYRVCIVVVLCRGVPR